MVARSLIALTARFSLFSLCFVTTDFVARGSTVVQQSQHTSIQSASLSSLVDKIQASGSDPIVSGLATNRVGSGFKILKSPSASGLHQLCADFDLNISASTEASEHSAEPGNAPHAAGSETQPSRSDGSADAHPSGSALSGADRPPCLDAADPACIPVDLARPLKQLAGAARGWAASARRWAGGVPTIFEVDAHGRLVVEGDDTHHDPNHVPPSAAAAAAANKLAAAAGGGLEPVSDDDDCGAALPAGAGRGGLQLRKAAGGAQPESPAKGFAAAALLQRSASVVTPITTPCASNECLPYHGDASN